MKIEEITNLRKQEQQNILRKPTCYKEENPQDLVLNQQKQLILQCLIKLFQEKDNSYQYSKLVNKAIDKIVESAIKESFTVNSFTGKGTAKTPYQIDCRFGNGIIIDARQSFKNNKYPKYIEPFSCFGNSFLYASEMANKGCKTKIVSGIFCSTKKPILHSVVEIEDKYVVDFNCNCIMSKDLYYNLFNFETLSIVKDKKLLKDNVLIKYKEELKNINFMYLNFAYDDMLDYLNNTNRQSKSTEFKM